MAGKQYERFGQPPSSRPLLVSHHSNSVPSTPVQLARDFEYRSRSPSPHDGLGSHSPRSVSSEANGKLPSLRKPHGGCRFETSAAFGRRRIPYDIGEEMLEKEEEEPKAALEPAEESKLSGDMRELYDQLLPSPESDGRRKVFVKKLERILREEWPGTDFQVHVFGSSGNLLCTSDSDVDICIQTPMKKLETVHMLAEALAKHGMEKVVCVPSAKVPIVKIWDPELRLACDMNVNNTLALENTRMIKTYVQIDDRVRPLAMIIKYWTSRRILNDAAFGGTLSSYTWICMILNFLQTREPPILPALHQIPDHRSVNGTGQRSDFADDLDALHGFGSANTETLGQLLFHFFRRYGHEIDYGASVVSVRHGKLLTRQEKGWDINSLTKEARNRICVEEPFNTSRNLGNSADPTASRGIHLEIRRAFSLLADGVLGPEYFARGDIHNQLYQQYQLLERQKAQLLAHTQAHAQATSQGLPWHSNTTNGSPQKTPYLNGHAGLHALDNPPATAPLVPGFLYHYPAVFEQAQSTSESSSREGVRTNPSSPAIAASVPLRRVPHRSSMATESPSASIRSQSQPARTIVGHLVAEGYPSVPVYDSTVMAGYPTAGSYQEAHTAQSNVDIAQNAASNYPVVSPVGDYGMPREYVGYLIDNSSRARPPFHQFAVPQIPPYREHAARRHRLSPDRGQSLMGESPRRISRSPSPLGHSRYYSTDNSSVPLPPPALPRSVRADSAQPRQPQGLAIANGSSPWVSAQPRDIGSISESFDVLALGDNASQPSMQEDSHSHNPIGLEQQPPSNGDSMYRQIPTQGVRNEAIGYSPVKATQPDIFSSIGHRDRFPALTEALLLDAPSRAEHDDSRYQENLSPKSRHQSGWPANLSREISAKPLDLSKNSVAASNDGPSTDIPLLSPVIETQTPPPTANRKFEESTERTMNGPNLSSSMPNGIETNPLPKLPLKREDVALNPNQPKKDWPLPDNKSSKDNASAASHINGWEKPKTSRKGGRKRASSGANRTAAEIKPRGQTMPTNEAERKGG
ncbi:hypothetical protein H2199_006384 [Coniosporium tulheliwenetii]|uniref:Uncharacterized protein n=1 Tax=Coniosporium tulheliwenetii TaxID=3383036 RepID=A0ACC2YVR4_9PEZI|nr:hypothetical protein H2199_006384 [Cladosporium sp. JES 115]